MGKLSKAKKVQGPREAVRCACGHTLQEHLTSEKKMGICGACKLGACTGWRPQRVRVNAVR